MLTNNSSRITFKRRTPLKVFASQSKNQIILLLFCSFFAYVVTCEVLGLAQNGVFPARKVRFTAVKARNGISYPNSTGIETFGLLMNGCHLPSVGEGLEGNGSLTVVGPQFANGYYFRVSDSPQASLPTIWLVESFDNDTLLWKVVGASVWRTGNQFQRQFYLLPGPTLDGGDEFRADYRSKWPWSMILAVHSGDCLGFLGSALVGCLGNNQSVRYFWYFMALNAGFFDLVSGLGRIAMGAEREAIYILLNVGVNLIFAIGIIIDESRLVTHFLILSGANFIASWVDEVLYGFDFVSLISRWLLDAGSVCIIVSVYILLNRFRILRNARALVRKDELAYRGAWAAEMSREGFEAALGELMALTQDLAKCCAVKTPRQCRLSAERARDSPLAHLCKVVRHGCEPFWRKSRIECDDALVSREEQHISRIVPIGGLDQLYFQARCLHPILLGRVHSWAQMSKGMFPIVKERDGLHFIRLIDVEAEDLKFIKWGQVKSVHRSIEKLIRSYSQARNQRIASSPFIYTMIHSQIPGLLVL